MAHGILYKKESLAQSVALKSVSMILFHMSHYTICSHLIFFVIYVDLGSFHNVPILFMARGEFDMNHIPYNFSHAWNCTEFIVTSLYFNTCQTLMKLLNFKTFHTAKRMSWNVLILTLLVLHYVPIKCIAFSGSIHYALIQGMYQKDTWNIFHEKHSDTMKHISTRILHHTIHARSSLYTHL